MSYSNTEQKKTLVSLATSFDPGEEGQPSNKRKVVSMAVLPWQVVANNRVRGSTTIKNLRSPEGLPTRLRAPTLVAVTVVSHATRSYVHSDSVGCGVGATVGCGVGGVLGKFVGLMVGSREGEMVGSREGPEEGTWLGDKVGDEVGAKEGKGTGTCEG